MATTKLPKIPVALDGFISYIVKHDAKSMVQALQPFKNYEKSLRELYAQEPGNTVLNDPHINTVPLFVGNESKLRISARNLGKESDTEKEKYILPLNDKDRKVDGAPAIVSSLKEFRHNFGIFSEQSLSELDWSNVVAAGSSALTPLLPVPKEYAASKRSIRNYYHNVIAPASDVDLFLYGLNEVDALEKIKHIERAVKDSILSETTTIRTKNAITIVSQHPVRHVQIVLRIYKSVSEILTGFDVDCSCVAYDGQQVYAAPRAVAALMTQINHIDLTRRSPSYESRLSKYSQRGFEVYWPELDRAKIDPTIYERSFPRTVGLARLLVLEKLPKDADRTNYNDQRRQERGRPVTYDYHHKSLRGNVKEDNVDNVADWEEDDQISNYHSLTIPYGPRLHARRIEKLLYTKDLLLNAEWNIKDRKVKLHRHPAFFGDAKHIFEDCCGFCPQAETEEEKLIAEEEARHYISGKVTFIVDNPGRQAIGSFNPLDADDWTAMAYVGDTGRICQAIVDHDVDTVGHLLQDGIDVNRRDYTGRTLLHLATMASSVEVVRCLLKHGAYIIPRVADGQTALHLAAVRGDADILQALYERSAENKERATKVEDEDKGLTENDKSIASDSMSSENEDAEVIAQSDTESNADSEVSAANSDISGFLKVEGVDKYMGKEPKESKGAHGQDATAETPSIEPKDDVLDANLPAWDTGCTPLHLAALFGNIKALQQLCTTFGADPKIPIKLMQAYNNSIPRDAILSLVLALGLPLDVASDVVKVLIAAGAKCSQANIDGITAFQFFANHSMKMLDQLVQRDKNHAKLALNYITFHGSAWGPEYTTPLRIAIENQDISVIKKLLILGAEYEIDHDSWAAALRKKFGNQAHDTNNDNFAQLFFDKTEQPVLLAVKQDCPHGVKELIDAGANVNTMNTAANLRLHGFTSYDSTPGQTLLDMVKEKIIELEQHEFFSPVVPVEEPTNLESLFDGVKENTYEHWAVSTYVRQTRNDCDKQVIEQRKLKQKREQDAPKQKQIEIVNRILDQFRLLEKYLVQNGAKTFVALHYSSAIKDEEERLAAEYQDKIRSQRQELSRQSQNKPRKESLHKFFVPNLTETLRSDYIALFEAAWIGNLTRIRELTMTFHGDNQDSPPLDITINDRNQHNAFDIALLRGHTDVALAMLDVVQAQYQPKDTKLSYTMASDDATECSDGEEDSDVSTDSGAIQLYSRLPASVRNQFTIEDIGEISHAVKGQVSPPSMLRRMIPLRSFVELGHVSIDKVVEGEDDHDIRTSFFGFAMHKNDLGLFKKLVDVALHYQKYIVDADKTGKEVFFGIWDVSDFETAMKLGRTDFMEVMISRTGAGLSFDHLIKGQGIEVPEKSQYYKGLSIRGKKNAAWAQSHRREWSYASLPERPLLLRACVKGNLKTVEWLLSDAPLRCYCAFAEANQGNDGVRALSQTKDGLKKTIADWLKTRQELAIACAIMSDYDEGKSEALVNYLIEVLPESVNAKSRDGRTALQLAFAYRRPTLAKVLTDAGAKVETTDKEGNNVLHVLFGAWRENSFSSIGASMDYRRMQEIMTVLDRDMVERLLLRRNAYSAGANTPLQQWLALQPIAYRSETSMHRECGSENGGCAALATLRLILDHSNGKDLLMINGSGDTAVHTAAINAKADYLAIMLERDPRCLLRENAVGRVPAEVARDCWLAEKTKESPQVGAGKAYWIAVDSARPLLQRDINWFVHADHPVKSPVEKAWDVCREHLENNRSLRRRLVSLAEANEVAKRLADKQRASAAQRSNTNRENDAAQGQNNQDEVEWFFVDVRNTQHGNVYNDTCPPIWVSR